MHRFDTHGAYDAFTLDSLPRIDRKPIDREKIQLISAPVSEIYTKGFLL